jgi:hypothetical protein
VIVSHKYKFIVLLPPKTASTSLHHFLSQPAFCEKRWDTSLKDQHAAMIPEGCEDYTTVTCWRNPLDRNISLWRHSQTQIAFQNDDSYPMDFDRFVKVYQPRAKLKFYRKSQAFWMNGIHFDVTWDFGDLRRDLMSFGPVVDAKKSCELEPLQRMNQTEHDLWDTYYTPELEDIVNERFAEDWESVYV